jgi:acyl CoA:acetate/3-ketoacid CoA transferase beta subunit
MNKVVQSASDAVADITSGSTLAVGGFGLCGLPWRYHTDRDGRAKILDECTLPLTGRGVVRRIITNLAVIDVDDGALILRETAPRVTSDEVQHATATDLIVDCTAGELRTIDA